MDRQDADLPPANISHRTYLRAVTAIAPACLVLVLLMVAATMPAAAAILPYSEATDSARADEPDRLQLSQNQQRSVPPSGRFDHLKTGFALRGAHRSVRCESCHVRGIFKGTPKVCAGCHSRASRIAATVKPANHVPSGSECDLCHTPTVWSAARFNHNTLGIDGTPRTCIRCHNGQTADRKSTRLNSSHSSVSRMPSSA